MPPKYIRTKASKSLGKMPEPVRKSIFKKFANVYKTASPPYFVRCSNIIMHSLDYVDLSTEKMFFKHREVRPLADLEKKRKMEMIKEPPLMPREGIYGKLVKPFPQTSPVDVVASGVREVRRHGPRLIAGKRRPVTSEDVRPKPATNISRISICGRTLGRRAWSCGVPPTEMNENASARLPPRKKELHDQRPQTATIDSHMRINVDQDYLETIRRSQQLRFKLKQHQNPDHNPLGDPNFARARYCVRHKTFYNSLHCRCRRVHPPFYPQEPSKWLSFSGGSVENEVDEATVSAYFHTTLPHDYSMEQRNGCTVAHSLLEHETTLMIGVNGQTAPSRVTAEEREQQEAARLAKFFDDPRVPLCWDDQLRKPGVRVVNVPGKQQLHTSQNQTASDQQLVSIHRAFSAPRPTICNKETRRVTKENEMFALTRQTRALENSKVTVLPTMPQRVVSVTDKIKSNDPLSYDDVLEILRQQAYQRERAEQMAAEAALASQRDSHNRTAELERQSEGHNRGMETLKSVLAERASTAAARTSPRTHSPLLSPTGGLVKPFSANTFRSGQQHGVHPDLCLRLRPRNPPPEARSSRASSRSSHSGRLITGARLHKTAAAQGASVGSTEPPEPTFINFVNAFRITGVDTIHDQAKNMVRQRTFESRYENMEPRQYPCTPVSQHFEDCESEDHAVADDIITSEGEEDAVLSTELVPASCITSPIHTEVNLESVENEQRSDSPVSIVSHVSIPCADDSARN